MRLAFWKKPAPVAAPSGECVHLWSNWSDPEKIGVKVWHSFINESSDRDGWAQDRHCLHCNIYERRVS